MVRARHTDRCTSCTSDRVRSDCLHQMHCQSHSACHALRQSVPLKGTKDYALAAISAVGALASAYCAYNGAGDGTFPATYYVNFTMIAFGMYAIGFFLVPTMLIDMNFNARTDYYHEFIARISGFNMLLIICKSLRAITDSPLQPPCNPFGFVIESLNGALCIACRAHLQCRHRHRLPNVRHLGGRHRPSRTHLCSAQAQPEANPRGSYASSLFVLDWRCPRASRHLLRHTTVDASSSRCACSCRVRCTSVGTVLSSGRLRCPTTHHSGCDERARAVCVGTSVLGRMGYRSAWHVVVERRRAAGGPGRCAPCTPRVTLLRPLVSAAAFKSIFKDAKDNYLSYFYRDFIQRTQARISLRSPGLARWTYVLDT